MVPVFSCEAEGVGVGVVRIVWIVVGVVVYLIAKGIVLVGVEDAALVVCALYYIPSCVV